MFSHDPHQPPDLPDSCCHEVIMLMPKHRYENFHWITPEVLEPPERIYYTFGDKWFRIEANNET